MGMVTIGIADHIFTYTTNFPILDELKYKNSFLKLFFAWARNFQNQIKGVLNCIEMLQSIPRIINIIQLYIRFRDKSQALSHPLLKGGANIASPF